MIRYHNTDTSSPVAEVIKDSVTIASASDILDIIGDISYSGCSAVIIHSESFSKEFYDLRTGVAGDILQKFSNYRMRLSIAGDFSHLTSRSWHDFIRESNRGKTVSFVATVDEAISALNK